MKCIRCQHPLDKEARGSLCLRCWIEHVRRYSKIAAEELEARYSHMTQEPVQVSLWQEVEA